MIRTVIFASVVVLVAAFGSCPLQRPTQCYGFRNSTLGRETPAFPQCSLLPPVQCPTFEGNTTNGEFLLFSEPLNPTSLLPLASQCPAPASQWLDFGLSSTLLLNASIVSNRK
nr:uncharacterized protein LOC113806975 [Penaeus vannamei]